MFVEEFDPPLVYALGNLLANLMRGPPLNHVESCPSILRLGTRRGTDEQRVLQLPLQAILLHMVGEGGGNLPEHLDQLTDALSHQLSFDCLLGIANTRKTRPSDIGAMREEVDKIFDLGQLLKH